MVLGDGKKLVVVSDGPFLGPKNFGIRTTTAPMVAKSSDVPRQLEPDLIAKFDK